MHFLRPSDRFNAVVSLKLKKRESWANKLAAVMAVTATAIVCLN